MLRLEIRLVTRLRPGNAGLEALPVVGAEGRASKTAFVGSTWEKHGKVAI